MAAWNGTRWVATGTGTNTLAFSNNGIAWTGLGTGIFSTTGQGVASAPAPEMYPSVDIVDSNYRARNNFKADGKLDVAEGALSIGNIPVTVTGSTSVAGRLRISSKTGTKTFSNDVNIGSRGSFNATASVSLSLGRDLNLATESYFNSTPKTLTIARNLTNKGYFNHNFGSVSFSNAQTASVSGSTVFHNLFSSTAGKKLKFQVGKIFSIGNIFKMTGSSGSNIKVESTASGSQSLWNFKSAQTGSTYLTVADSGCFSGSANITLDDTSTNGGNNSSCWVFSGVAPTPSPDVSNYGGGGGVSVGGESGGGTPQGGGGPGGGDPGESGESGGGNPQGGGDPNGGGGESPVLFEWWWLAGNIYFGISQLINGLAGWLADWIVRF